MPFAISTDPLTIGILVGVILFIIAKACGMPQAPKRASRRERQREARARGCRGSTRYEGSAGGSPMWSECYYCGQSHPPGGWW